MTTSYSNASMRVPLTVKTSKIQFHHRTRIPSNGFCEQSISLIISTALPKQRRDVKNWLRFVHLNRWQVIIRYISYVSFPIIGFILGILSSLTMSRLYLWEGRYYLKNVIYNYLVLLFIISNLYLVNYIVLDNYQLIFKNYYQTHVNSLSLRNKFRANRRIEFLIMISVRY